MFTMILYMKMISSNLLCSYIEFTLYTHILHHTYPNQFFWRDLACPWFSVKQGWSLLCETVLIILTFPNIHEKILHMDMALYLCSWIRFFFSAVLTHLTNMTCFIIDLCLNFLLPALLSNPWNPLFSFSSGPLMMRWICLRLFLFIFHSCPCFPEHLLHLWNYISCTLTLAYCSSCFGCVGVWAQLVTNSHRPILS